MRLYYRADTRSPRTIFKTGFTPRNEIFEWDKPTWWKQGIRNYNKSDFSPTPKTTASDADMNNSSLFI